MCQPTFRKGHTGGQDPAFFEPVNDLEHAEHAVNEGKEQEETCAQTGA